jgi:hypothetical protein
MPLERDSGDHLITLSLVASHNDVLSESLIKGIDHCLIDQARIRNFTADRIVNR